MEPVVSLSHTVVSMAPACGGDVVTASVFASNVSTTEQVRKSGTDRKRATLTLTPTSRFVAVGLVP